MERSQEHLLERPRQGDPCVYKLYVCTKTVLSIVYSGKTHLSHRGQDSGFLWGGRRCWIGRAPGVLLGDGHVFMALELIIGVHLLG